MSPYVIAPGHGKAVYDLVTVSNHYGGMGGGHCKYFLRAELLSVCYNPPHSFEKL